MLLMGKTKHDKQTTKELNTTKTYSQIMALEDGHAGGFCFLESEERERKKKLSFTFFRMGFQQSRSKIVRLPGNEVDQIQLQLHCEGQVFPSKLCIQSCLQKKIE